MSDPTYIACPRCGEPCAMTAMQKRLYHGRTITCQRCAKPFQITEETPDPQPVAAARPWSPPVSQAAPMSSSPPEQPQTPDAASSQAKTAPIRKPTDGISPGRMAIVIAVVAVVVSALLYLAIAPSISRSREAARRASCASNLTQIGFALQLYANSNTGRFPDSLAMLVADGSIPAEFLVCPSSSDTIAPGKTSAEQAANLAKGPHQTYLYAGKGVIYTPVKTLLVYEPLTAHADGVNALYSDGTVQYFPRATALTAIPQLAGTSSPTTTTAPAPAP